MRRSGVIGIIDWFPLDGALHCNVERVLGTLFGFSFDICYSSEGDFPDGRGCI
jgi:hypothetical protein